MFAGLPDVTDIGSLLRRGWYAPCSARANVRPTFFDVEPNEKHEPMMSRDQVALELTKLVNGKSCFGVCRGIQK